MFAGHVEEIDSDIKRFANDGYSLRSVLINTKLVAAQPDDRRSYSRASKFSHFHTKTPYSSLHCRSYIHTVSEIVLYVKEKFVENLRWLTHTIRLTAAFFSPDDAIIS